MTPAELPEPATITIERILEEEVDSDGTPELRLVLYAGLASKRIVLDKTGLRILADLFGDETDDWLGKRVSVFNDTSVLNQGRRGGIRFRPVAGASGVPPPSLHRPGRLLSPCSQQSIRRLPAGTGSFHLLIQRSPSENDETLQLFEIDILHGFSPGTAALTFEKIKKVQLEEGYHYARDGEYLGLSNQGWWRLSLGWEDPLSQRIGAVLRKRIVSDGMGR